MARLGYAGSASPLRRKLFPHGFSGEVMLLIVKTWNSFSFNNRVRHETCITALFRDALISAYIDAGRKWFIVLEDPITDPNFGTELGRNDLRFYPQNHKGQTIFFTVECKRLRVTTNTGVSELADKYVDQGVQRFVDGKYSAGLPCGGMVGYVMDNEMSKAFDAVQDAIKVREKEIKLRDKGFRTPSSVLPNHRWSIDTKHTVSDGEIAIHHALLGVVQ